jgi:hypothetical protein
VTDRPTADEWGMSDGACRIVHDVYVNTLA